MCSIVINPVCSIVVLLHMFTSGLILRGQWWSDLMCSMVVWTHVLNCGLTPCAQWQSDPMYSIMIWLHVFNSSLTPCTHLYKAKGEGEVRGAVCSVVQFLPPGRHHLHKRTVVIVRQSEGVWFTCNIRITSELNGTSLRWGLMCYINITSSWSYPVLGNIKR